MPTYREGDSLFPLQQRALDQKIQEISQQREESPEGTAARHAHIGKTGGEMAVNSDADYVKDVRLAKPGQIGPVSGDHMAAAAMKKKREASASAKETKRIRKRP
jgi:hypothetical protein